MAQTKDLDWRSRRKECQAKLKKEERALSALMESRQVLQEELDEVIQQLSDQVPNSLVLYLSPS